LGGKAEFQAVPYLNLLLFKTPAFDVRIGKPKLHQQWAIEINKNL
jgi:hypothetical protein